jgi:hypothetical protein
MKNILHLVHFGTPRGAKMSLALIELTKVAHRFKFKHYLQACTTIRKKLMTLHAKQSKENIRGPTPVEKSPLIEG